MTVRLLKAERDRGLAINRGIAVREVHLTMDSPLSSVWSLRQAKKPHQRKRMVSQRRTRKNATWIQANTCICICENSGET